MKYAYLASSLLGVDSVLWSASLTSYYVLGRPQWICAAILQYSVTSYFQKLRRYSYSADMHSYREDKPKKQEQEALIQSKMFPLSLVQQRLANR